MADTAPAGSIKAGGAYVELFTVDGKFQKGLASAQNKLRDFAAQATKAGAALAAAGTAMVAGLIGTAKVFADTGAALSDMSQRTGVTVESLSALQYAAGQSGTSLEKLEDSLKDLSKNLVEAGQGNQGIVDTLTQLGVSLNSLQGLNTEQQFLKMADALSKVPDVGTRAAIAMKLFGEGGRQLLPLMAGGAAGIRKLMNDARELGVVLSNDDAQAAKKLKQEFTELHASFEALKITVGSAVAGELTSFLKYLNDASPAVLKAVSENKEWIHWIGQLSAKLGGIGLAMGGMGTAAYALSTAIGVLRTATIGLTASLGLIGGIGAVAAIAVIADEIGKQITLQRDLNRELERSIDLREKLAQVGSGQTQKTVEESRNHGGDDRQAFLQQNIKTELKNLDQKEKRVAQLEGEIAELEAKAAAKDQTAEEAKKKYADNPEAATQAKAMASMYRSQAAEIRTGDLADEQSIMGTIKTRLETLQQELEAFRAEEVNMDRSVHREDLGQSRSNLTYDEASKGEAEKFGFSISDGLSDLTARQRQETAKVKRMLEEEADALADTMLAPAEKLQKRMEHLKTLQENGLPQWAYDAAVKQAKVESGAATANQKLPELDQRTTNAAALQQGSQEAFSAMVQAMNGRNHTETQIAKNTADTARALTKMERNQKRDKGEKFTLVVKDIH